MTGSKSSAHSGTRARSFIEQARRAQIIACAIECISEIGYLNTTVAEVARRAEISKGVVFYHFEGKDDLFWQVVVEIYTDAALSMHAAISEAPSWEGKLRRYIESNLEYFRANTAKGLVLQDVFRHWHPANNDAADGQLVDEESVMPLQELLAAGQAAGEFRDFSPRLMAIAIRRAIDGALEEWSHHLDHDISAYAHELVEMFERATRRSPR